jgi:hypothetical protein
MAYAWQPLHFHTSYKMQRLDLLDLTSLKGFNEWRLINVSFRFLVLPSSTYLFTAGVEGFCFSLDHTQTHTTVGRTPLEEGSARRRDLYLAT